MPRGIPKSGKRKSKKNRDGETMSSHPKADMPLPFVKAVAAARKAIDKLEEVVQKRQSQGQGRQGASVAGSVKFVSTGKRKTKKTKTEERGL